MSGGEHGLAGVRTMPYGGRGLWPFERRIVVPPRGRWDLSAVSHGLQQLVNVLAVTSKSVYRPPGSSNLNAVKSQQFTIACCRQQHCIAACVWLWDNS